MKIKIEEKPVVDSVWTWFLSILFATIFAIPLITTVPGWYVTIEVAIGVILIATCTIGTIVMALALASDQRLKVDIKFITVKRFIGWGLTGLMLVSMLAQEMDTIFVLYLIGVLGLNVTTHFWLKTSVDIETDS